MTGDWYLTSRTVTSLGPYGFARLLAYDVRDKLAPDRRRVVREVCRDEAERVDVLPPPNAPTTSEFLRVVQWFRYASGTEVFADVECTKCFGSSVRKYRRWADAARAKVRMCPKCSRKAVRQTGLIAGGMR